MSTDVIQAQYDDLATIASRFGQQMDATSDLYHRMIQSYQPLEQGGWQGQGGAAFCNEMQDEVFPAMQRLMVALSEAQMVTLQVRDIIRQAEEEAAGMFGGDGAGGEGGGDGAGGEAGAGSSGAGNDNTATDSMIEDNISNKKIFSHQYMDDMVDRTWAGEGSDELRWAMNTLRGDPNPADVARALDIIATQRGIDRAVIEQQYQKFKDLQAKAIANGRERGEEIDSLPDIWQSYMGSRGQLRYGQIVGDALGLDPVFGALLNPTGGLPGPGADAIPAGDTAIAYHSAFHDAGGFLKLHFEEGPGFDYLGLEGGRSNEHPFTGQESGLLYWHARMILDNAMDLDASNLHLDLRLAPVAILAGSGMGAAVDIKTGIDTVATGIHNVYEDATGYIGNAAQDVTQDVGEFVGNLFSW